MLRSRIAAGPATGATRFATDRNPAHTITVKTINRHLAGAVFSGTLAALGVLLPLIAFVLIADELDDVGEGRYDLLGAFWFVALSLPGYAYQLAPYATLIGSLTGVGLLASHHELVALRAAGVSVMQITVAIARAGLMIAAIAIALGEGLAPQLEQYAQRYKANAVENKITLKSRYGFWARDGQTFINIREVLPGGHLKDIFIYQMDEQFRLQVTTHAAEALFRDSAWVLKDIRQSRIDGEQIRVRHIQQATWNAFLDPGLLSIIIMDPNLLPIWGLYDYIQFMRANGQDAQLYLVNFWKKLTMPAAIMAMLLLTVPLLFGSSREAGIGQRVFVGVVLGVSFYLLDRISGHLAVVYGLPAMLTALAPSVIATLASIRLFRSV